MLCIPTEKPRDPFSRCAKTCKAQLLSRRPAKAYTIRPTESGSSTYMLEDKKCQDIELTKA